MVESWKLRMAPTPNPGLTWILYVAMGNTFFILMKADDPWGDYGDVLMHGDAGRSDDGVLQLERTAPFVPPISLPGLSGIVVTDRFRKEIEQTMLRGFTFRSIEKTRIVRIPWHDGSRNTEEPPEYPDSGEPENYILGQSHDHQAAKEVGDLWELVPSMTCYTTRKSRIVNSHDDITLVTENWDGSDIFVVDGVLYHYVTLQARDWFLSRVPKLITFGKAVKSSAPPSIAVSFPYK